MSFNIVNVLIAIAVLGGLQYFIKLFKIYVFLFEFVVESMANKIFNLLNIFIHINL